MKDAERYAVIVRKVLVDDQEVWRATVRELPDLAEFAETREEALDLALDAIESLKASAAEDGLPFPEPIEDEEDYSGRVTLRMSKSMHRAVNIRADIEDVSLNSYIVECIALRLGSLNTAQTSEAYVTCSDIALLQAGEQIIGPLGTTSLNMMSIEAMQDISSQRPYFGHLGTIGTVSPFSWGRTTTQAPPEKRKRA